MNLKTLLPFSSSLLVPLVLMVLRRLRNLEVNSLKRFVGLAAMEPEGLVPFFLLGFELELPDGTCKHGPKVCDIILYGFIFWFLFFVPKNSFESTHCANGISNSGHFYGI